MLSLHTDAPHRLQSFRHWRSLQSWLSLTLLSGLLAVSLATPVQAAPANKATHQATYKAGVTKVRHAVRHAVPKRKAVVAPPRRKASAPAAVSVVPAGVTGAQATNASAATHDMLNLKSRVALVVDQNTNEVLFRKNDEQVLPIASLTKLMTGLIISEAGLPMDEIIRVTQEDVDTEKGSSSRLRVGTELSRGELLHLALMSSENRAAHALGRTYPGGLPVFVSLMNDKARLLGMKDTVYIEPTGLSSRNQSSARDLVKLVDVAHHQPLLRELTTSPSYQVSVGSRQLQYNNTNRLVKNPAWDIGLQKTGYIAEAGQCLVMQTRIAGRQLIMVFLDSVGKFSRLGDAERVRHWIESAANTTERREPIGV